MITTRIAMVLSASALVVAGCDSDDGNKKTDVGNVADTSTPDAGTPDAGTPDAGTPDAGTPDAGTPDAGTPDAGTPDTSIPVTCGDLTFASTAFEFDDSNAPSFILGGDIDLGFGASDKPDALVIEFWDTSYDAAGGTFDLGSAGNSNYSDCTECVRLVVDISDLTDPTDYFQVSGSLTIDADPASGFANITIAAGTKLVEVGIGEGAVSTPVPNGTCFTAAAEITGARLCTPSCGDRVCGDDGCGGTCGDTACLDTETCAVDGSACLASPSECITVTPNSNTVSKWGDSGYEVTLTEQALGDVAGADSFDVIFNDRNETVVLETGTYDFTVAPNDDSTTCNYCMVTNIDWDLPGGRVLVPTEGAITFNPGTDFIAELSFTTAGIKFAEVDVDASDSNTTVLLTDGACVMIPDATYMTDGFVAPAP